MASNNPQVNSSDPAVAQQVQRENTALQSQRLTSAPSVTGSGDTATTASRVARSLAPIVGGSEVLYPQATTTTSSNAVTINSSINNDTGDVTTVYSTNGQITVNPINQTINQYTSTDSGVSQIVAGNGVTITSTGASGTGVVTINSVTTTLGNIVTVNLDGNVANVLHGDGSWSADQTTYSNSNVVSLMAAFGSNTITTTGNVSVGNIIGNGQALTGIAGANVSGFVPNANVANTAFAVAGANVSGFVPNANVANTAYSVSSSNVSGLGNIATISLTGSSSNILYGNGVFAPAPAVTLSGDGGNISNIQGANVSGFVPNANVANTAFAVAGANVSGFVPNANVANTAFAVAAANVSGLGNIATINLTGSTSNVLLGNGTFGAVPGLGNVGGANFDGNASNVLYGNGSFAAGGGGGGGSSIANGNSNVSIASANGNVTFGITGNANVLVVTGTGANITGTANITGNLSAGNISANGTITANGNIATTSYLTSGAVTYTNSAGTNGQVLVADGIGGTYWATTGSGGAPLNATAIINGTSNVTIGSPNSNISIGVGGNANVATIDSANVSIAANGYINLRGAPALDQPISIGGRAGSPGISISSAVTIGNITSQEYSDMSVSQFYVSTDGGNIWGAYQANGISLNDAGSSWQFEVTTSQMRQESGNYSTTYSPSPSTGVNMYDSDTSSYLQLSMNSGLDYYESTGNVGYTLGSDYWYMYTEFNNVFDLTSNAASNTATANLIGTFTANNINATNAFQLPIYSDNTARDTAVVTPATGMMVFVTGSGMQVYGATQWNAVSGTST